MLVSCSGNNKEKTVQDTELEVRGWNILSDNLEKGVKAINSSMDYGINHLQLSHKLIMDLKDVRDDEKLTKTTILIDKARQAGIKDIFLWDHALYKLDYYPDEFKNEDGLINLDNPKFWEWFKKDYKSMLDKVPNIDGIVLTFIETGAHVEDQYSKKWLTESDKLANLVDSVASVVIDERDLQLYIRTFIYYKEELNALLECVNKVKHPNVKIMTKEAPHDFFLTHPPSGFISSFNKEAIIEFDLGHEYNGQGIIASILPEKVMERWKFFAQHEHVKGYVARTDRYGDTQNVGRPTEINLYALRRITQDTTLTPEAIVKEFIAEKYGGEAVDALSPVFLETKEIIESIFYTLGLQTTWHSRFDLNYESIYTRHVSGKWLDPPIAEVKHGVNKTFHYWKDIVETLAPAHYKRRDRIYKAKKGNIGDPTFLQREAPYVFDNKWLSPDEKMNLEYLTYIITEKEYGVKKALWALNEIEKAKPLINGPYSYDELYQLYERTYIAAKLYLAGAKAYYGYRAYLNTPDNQSIQEITKEGLSEMLDVCDEIKAYPFKGAVGQLNWAEDVDRAKSMHDKIVNGWFEFENKKFEVN